MAFHIDSRLLLKWKIINKGHLLTTCNITWKPHCWSAGCVGPGVNNLLDHLAGPNSYLTPPYAAYMRRWIGSELVQIMACRLFVGKPLPKAMLSYCQLEQTSVKFWSKYKTFHLRIFRKYRLWKDGYFVQREMSELSSRLFCSMAHSVCYWLM